LAGKLNARHSLGDLGRGGGIILQWISDRHCMASKQTNKQTNTETMIVVVVYKMISYNINYKGMYSVMMIGLNRLRIVFVGGLL
jgi:hypothetical protein